MASQEARDNSPCDKNGSIEGVSGLIPYTGTTEKYLKILTKHLQTAQTYYAGCRNWDEFRRETKFNQITSAGWDETKTHVL